MERAKAANKQEEQKRDPAGLFQNDQLDNLI